MILNQTKMRLRTLILVCSGLLAAACAKTSFEENVPQEEGSISIQLAPEIEVKSETKAMAGGPDKNEFKIEIYKYTSSDLVRLYRDSYANTVGQKIKLNSAPYKIHARHGDSLAAGFNSIYYAGQAIVNVRPQTDESVTIEAKMANVKVAVEYGDNLKYDWPEYYVKVKSTTPCGRKRNLQFSQTEKRAGYLPHGNFVVELYVKIGEEWKYYHSPQMEALPNDFITFKVNTEKAESDAVLTARIDRDLEVIEKSLMMSSDWLPKDAPVIVQKDGNGADFGNQTFTIIEANNNRRSDLKADINVPGRIKNCWLEVTSDYLAGLGVPSRVDLAGDLEPSVEQALKSVGLKWMKGMSGQRLAYVDFSGITAWLDQQPCGSNPFNATFSLDVIDQRQAVGQTQSEPVKFVQGKPAFEFYDIPSYNCWAWKIENITTNVSAGNPERVVLEYKKSTDGESAWTVMTPSATSGTRTKDYDLTGLQPGTTYNFRLTYNGNPLTRVTKSATTEVAAQVGNNSFEQHTYETFNFSISWSTAKGSRTWYQLYKSGETDPWWAVNSTATLDNKFTAAYWYYKCFPTVCVTNDNVYAGNRSVILASIAVNDWGSDAYSGDAVTGEVYIGKADNSGEHKNEHVSNGHSFASRPSSMSFYCKFDCHDSPFGAEIKLYNGSTQIASGSYTSEQASVSSWTRVDIPLTYSHTDRKADKIYIAFASSSTNSTSSRTTTLNVLNTSGSNSKTENIHAGNIVWLDEVVLIYE